MRHLSYFPELFWIPIISPFFHLSIPAYIYLGILGFFGQYDKVVKFYTELVTVYYPMTGIDEYRVLS
ncbi:UNKNOWN [Stylonychia lemnae]|uniref:Uncharacterized protein n=1 Tax=Stylonychia lemnae TaxID=5949 RepID=A0A078APP6_STYLE|nr:UNKNOWN [Stylonychia lemnae]|eukprot:CDW83936.1 UNKNOWN [Stylonychia lemnae]